MKVRIRGKNRGLTEMTVFSRQGSVCSSQERHCERPRSKAILSQYFKKTQTFEASKKTSKVWNTDYRELLSASCETEFR